MNSKLQLWILSLLATSLISSCTSKSKSGAKPEPPVAVDPTTGTNSDGKQQPNDGSSVPADAPPNKDKEPPPSSNVNRDPVEVDDAEAMEKKRKAQEEEELLLLLDD